jgi:tRNA (guanosine-2'-O-)-methyltransferase
MNLQELDPELKLELLSFMEGFISDNKSSLFDNIIQKRTKHITIALEDIYQSHNASAVLRTCDCFGIQDVHIIENRNTYIVNPDVALGSTKWLNLNKYNTEEDNTLGCYKSLHEKGYRIVATTPHKGDTLLDDLSLDGKIALIFGTEQLGLSKTAIQHADEYVKIPMHGFTESFNISVSAAIILHHLTEKLRKSDISWQLSQNEMIDTRISWVRSVLKYPENYEKEFMINHGLI